MCRNKSLCFLLIHILSFSSIQSQSITFIGHDGINTHYLSLKVLNIDASSCGDSISTVAIFENNVWRPSSTNYLNEGERVHDWRYNQVTYDTLLPIDIRITMSSGIIINLPDIITNLNEASQFISNQQICVCYIFLSSCCITIPQFVIMSLSNKGTLSPTLTNQV